MTEEGWKVEKTRQRQNKEERVGEKCCDKEVNERDTLCNLSINPHTQIE